MNNSIYNITFLLLHTYGGGELVSPNHEKWGLWFLMKTICKAHIYTAAGAVTNICTEDDKIMGPILFR